MGRKLCFRMFLHLFTLVVWPSCLRTIRPSSILYFVSQNGIHFCLFHQLSRQIRLASTHLLFSPFAVALFQRQAYFVFHCRPWNCYCEWFQIHRRRSRTRVTISPCCLWCRCSKMDLCFQHHLDTVGCGLVHLFYRRTNVCSNTTWIATAPNLFSGNITNPESHWERCEVSSEFTAVLCVWNSCHCPLHWKSQLGIIIE